MTRRLDVCLGLAFFAAFSLAGCATPSARIATELTRYGLDATQAACVGDRLEANLSIGQLQELGRAARAIKEGDNTPGRLTASDLLRVASRIEDPRVPIEVAKAAAGCGIVFSTRQPGSPYP
jgi:hypothetical protein